VNAGNLDSQHATASSLNHDCRIGERQSVRQIGMTTAQVHHATARTSHSPLWLLRPTNNSNALASTTSFLQVANTCNLVEEFVFRSMVMHQHPINISSMSTQQRIARKLESISYVKILDTLMSESKSRQLCDAKNRQKTGV
jgi:hypothetical protein